MKFLKLFIVFFLIMPLWLYAADPVLQTTENTTQEAVTENNKENSEVKTETDTSSEQVVPKESDSVSETAVKTPVNANPNLIPQETLPQKSFNNSVEGSKAFIENMLSLVYTELPKRNNNQEIFNYLSLVTSEYFAFTYMSKWTAGREVIKDIPSDLQQRYLDSSKEFMILLYGEIFNTYYKQYTYRVGEVIRKSDTQYEIKMRVESKLQDARNQDAILNVVWKVKYSAKENKFFIIDVDVNGIVFLNTQKKQFADMLKSTNNDFSKFIDLLDKKNAESKKRLGIMM